MKRIAFAVLASCLAAAAHAADVTFVNTPSGNTNPPGGLVSGGLVQANGPHGVTDSGLSASHVTTDTNTQTLQNKSISGAQNTISAVPATSLTGVVPAANGGAGTVTGALKSNGAGLVSQAASADLSDAANIAHLGANTFAQRQTINLNSASLPTPQTGTALQIGQANGTATRTELDSWAMPSFFTGVRADGTAASPTALVNNDQINGINTFGYDGTSYGGPWSSFRCYAGANWTNLVHGTYCGVAVTANTAISSMADVVQFTPTGIQWPATTAPFSGQDINDQKGTAFSIYVGQMGAFSAGTNASPVTTAGPMFSFDKTESIASAICAGNPQLSKCNYTVEISNNGLSTDQMQIGALDINVTGRQSSCGNCNAAGIHESITGVGSFAGQISGGQIQVTNSTTTGSGAGLKIYEMDEVNNGDPCVINDYTSSGNCKFLGLSSQGTATVGFGIHFLNGGGGILEGITANVGSIQHFFLNDQSSSAVSLNIAGTHATAAINVASGAGNVVLGGNNILGAGSLALTGSPLSAASGQVAFGSTVVAASNCGALTSSTGCLQINVAGTNRFIPYY